MRPDLRCELHFLPRRIQFLQTLLLQLLQLLLKRGLLRLVLRLFRHFSLENGETHAALGLRVMPFMHVYLERKNQNIVGFYVLQDLRHRLAVKRHLDSHAIVIGYNLVVFHQSIPDSAVSIE